MNNQSFVIGFIGFGKFSNVRINILLRDRRVVIGGYFDPYVVADKRFKKFDNVDDLIANVDAIFVSVPPAMAPKYVVKSLEAKKHVFCEKPAAINYEKLKQIEPYLSDHLTLAYGFNHRQHGSIRRISEIIESGHLGKVLWMRGRYGKEVDDSYKHSWRCDPELNGGGILIDQGIHLVDLMNEFAGGFDYSSAVMSNNHLNIDGVEDNAFINFASTKHKITASLHSTITQWRYLFSLEIFLERGSIILNGLRTNSGNYGEERLVIKPNKSALAPYEGDIEYLYEQNDSWEYEVKDFVDSCVHSRPYQFAGYSDAVKVTRLVDRVYKSAKWI